MSRGCRGAAGCTAVKSSASTGSASSSTVRVSRAFRVGEVAEVRIFSSVRSSLLRQNSRYWAAAAPKRPPTYFWSGCKIVSSTVRPQPLSS